MAEKVACHRCRHFGVPAFDGKCTICAAPLDDPPRGRATGMQAVGRAREYGGISDSIGGENMKCSNCEAIVESKDAHFCTACGCSFTESAGAPASETAKVTCVTCGLNGIAVTESICPRCADVLEGKGDDEDDEDEKDDTDGDDGEDDSDDDEGDDDGKKKLLLDKGKKARTEGQVYVDLAQALVAESNTRGLELLAAHVVYCESDEDTAIEDRSALAETPPPWVASKYAQTWKEAVTHGRPRTMMSAIANFKGMVARS